MQSNNPPPNVTIVLECLECGARDDVARGWRAYLEPDADGVLVFCPSVQSGVRLRGLATVAQCSPRSCRRADLPRSGQDAPGVGTQLEPIGPGSRELKVKDPGGRPGGSGGTGDRAAHTDAPAGARLPRGDDQKRCRLSRREPRARTFLQRAPRGADDPDPCRRFSATPRCVESPRWCRRARRGWTDDIYGSSRRAGLLLQHELVASTGARNLGVVERSDLTGFNWSDVPAVLVETGFMSSPSESALLRSAGYQQKLARALVRATQRFVSR